MIEQPQERQVFMLKQTDDMIFVHDLNIIFKGGSWAFPGGLTLSKFVYKVKPKNWMEFVMNHLKILKFTRICKIFKGTCLSLWNSLILNKVLKFSNIHVVDM